MSTDTDIFTIVSAFTASASSLRTSSSIGGGSWPKTAHTGDKAVGNLTFRGPNIASKGRRSLEIVGKGYRCDAQGLGHIDFGRFVGEGIGEISLENLVFTPRQGHAHRHSATVVELHRGRTADKRYQKVDYLLKLQVIAFIAQPIVARICRG